MTELKLAQKDQLDWGSTYKERMSYALDHGLFSNVIFLVGTNEEVIRGHRDILIFGSTIFKALLTDNRLNGSLISIRDVQPCGFKPLLKYFYERKIPKIPDEDYMEFFKAVKYFKVEELYKVCRDHVLKTKLKLENAIDVYENCKVLKEKELEESIESFIKRNAESILAQPKFSDISAASLLHFIASDDFSAPEVSIYLAVYKWGEAECKRQKLEMKPENLQLVLKDIIPQIRFPLMNSDAFAVEIDKLNLPNNVKTLAVYDYFFARHLKKHQIPEGGQFISNQRKRVKYEDPDAVDNIVWNLDGRIWTGLETDTMYTISNKRVGSVNYLNVYSNSNVVVAKNELAKYEFGGAGYLSTFWRIRRGSKPNSYTLFSKYRNGYLTWVDDNSIQIFGPDYIIIKFQNLTFEPSKKFPGYFLMTTESKNKYDEYMVMGLSEDPIGDGFSAKFMKNPEEEVDSILWKIQKI